MAFTYDPTTNRGKVRLIITDSKVAYEIFPDADIDAFLAIHADDIFLASAQALDTIASSEALIQKRITNLGLSTDGPAVAAALRAHAATLRQQSANSADSTAFDWAEWDVGPFSAREIRRKAAMRNA